MFNILNHLNKLEDVEKNGTWIKAKCPICGGVLKISTTEYKSGAYACYSEECHRKNPNPIKKLLYTRTAFNQYSSFSLFKPVVSMTEIVKPVPITASPSDFLTNVRFRKPKQIVNNTDILTYFYYSNNFRIVRVDRKTSEGKVKFLFEEYKDENENFVKGVPQVLPQIPFFEAKYIQPNVLMVEGEKTALAGQANGIATITMPGFLFSSMYLSRALRVLKSEGVQNVLYLRDNDAVGLRKANDVKLNLWKLGIGCKVVNLAEIYNFEDKGFDLYDLYKIMNIENIKLLEDCFGAV